MGGQNSLPYYTKLSLLDEGEGGAGGGAATGATDAMDVIFVSVGEIEVDNVTDIGDIETTSGHIGGDENLNSPLLEETERALALTLALVAMDGVGLETAFDQRHRELLHAILGPPEDQNF